MAGAAALQVLSRLRDEPVPDQDLDAILQLSVEVLGILRKQQSQRCEALSESKSLTRMFSLSDLTCILNFLDEHDDGPCVLMCCKRFNTATRWSFGRSQADLEADIMGVCELLSTYSPRKLSTCLSSPAKVLWATSMGLPWDHSICEAAAFSGRIDVLQLAISRGCPWSDRFAIWAAGHGHLQLLCWAISKGCPWDRKDCCRWAAGGGHLNVLEWAMLTAG